MKKLVFILIAFVAYSFSVSANDYSVNELAIDQMFSQADELSSAEFADFTGTNVQAQLSSVNPWAAWALTWTAGVGICGVHRLYLGSTTGVFLVYLCTGGGCGIIQTVDWVVLLIAAIDGSASRYEGNSKIIMW
ncbi:MAG: TM2 domain-containing protein [Bacteroidales bacterium]|nr:TM2 domain-containing protein [Bacteroidales bacterium]MDY0215534.1 TM2 domain-containing protein [Bacteroidales bacterium]